MHRYLAEVFATLDAAHAQLRSATESVTEPLRSRRPGENRWSVNEVLEHVAIVETRFSKMVGESIAHARHAGLGPEQHAREPLPGEMATRLVDRSTPRAAPETAQPTGRLTAQEAWAAVERSHETMRNTLLAADGLALSQVTHAHPFFGALTPYQWIELLSGHRLRHAAQIREAGAAVVQA